MSTALGVSGTCAMSGAMRAIVYERYGGPEHLSLREIARPIPAPGQVRVRVHAAAINSWDWDLMYGTVLVRPWGLRKPRWPILGCDIAGRVEAVGAGVERLAVGDAVFGDISHAGWGGFAEFVCASETALCHKPQTMGFVAAAATPQAGVLALQGLALFGPLAGRRLLILGAGGGVGTFAVQLAKTAGAEVTVVDAGEKLATLRALGADDAIDYRSDDFTRRAGRYDALLDVVGRRPLLQALRALTRTGVYVMVGGTPSHILQVMALSPLLNRFSKRRLRVLSHQPRRADLATLCEHFERGQVTPVIDRVCGLAEVPAAIDQLGRGEITGKVVASIYEP